MHACNNESDLPDSVPLLNISAGLLLGHFVGAGASSIVALERFSMKYMMQDYSRPEAAKEYSP